MSQSQAGRSEPYIKKKMERGRRFSCSRLHPTCICHFSFTSYIPRMLAPLFPVSCCERSDFIAWDRLGGGFWKRKIGFCAEASQRLLSRMRVHTTSNNNNTVKWNGVTLIHKQMYMALTFEISLFSNQSTPVQWQAICHDCTCVPSTFVLHICMLRFHLEPDEPHLAAACSNE